MALIKNRALAEKILHYLTAFILCLKGWSKIEHHHTTVGIIILLFGVTIALMNFFHHRLEHIAHRLPSIILFIESFVTSLVFYTSIEEGWKKISFAWLLAAIMFFIAGIIHWLKPKQHH
jgi:uncharacterized membrane protein